MIAEFRPAIESAAQSRALDPRLVAAIVAVESSGDPWAHNPEGQYRYLWDVRHDRPFRKVTANELADKWPPVDFGDLRGHVGQFADHEWWNQRASWGLMQVMGAVARELGCRLPYLTALCDPAINLHFGVQLLARLLTHQRGSLDRALQAYNGGIGSIGSETTSAYARRVLARYSEIPW